jgi:hypothetical protein
MTYINRWLERMLWSWNMGKHCNGLAESQELCDHVFAAAADQLSQNNEANCHSALMLALFIKYTTLTFVRARL